MKAHFVDFVFHPKFVVVVTDVNAIIKILIANVACN
jgi:hypothetical protein